MGGTGGHRGGESPDEAARKHDRIQREAENRAGSTDGGLTAEDLGRINRQQVAEDMARATKQALERADERVRQAGAGREPTLPPAESILDEIDDSQAATGVMGLAPDTPKPPGSAKLLTKIGVGTAAALALTLFLFDQLRDEPTPVPDSSTIASTTTASGTTGADSTTMAPVTEAPQVTGTATATASFTKVSGPCTFAAQFTDTFSFAVTNGALVLTQLSNGHQTNGTMAANGDFATTAEGQGYTGTVSGATARGQNTYTADGCNEVYDFTMQLSGSLVSALTS